MTAADPDPDASAHPSHDLELASLPLPLLVARSVVGGALMGLANLVPGISGGTMLLAAGVYPAFIGAIADLSTLRIRLRPVLTAAVIAGAAALAILLLAGLMKTLVIEHRWVMYSLFIGLTLGGVPLVWRLAQPLTPGVFLGGLAGFGLMVTMQLGLGGGGGGDASLVLLFLSGLAGASAMILPGVSGGYLLLILGQYERILGAVDEVKEGLLGPAGLDLGLVFGALDVVIPVGLGVVAGVVGVSNLLRWLLARHEAPTLGVLLGLLFGAVVGLWPFERPIEPQPGQVIEGRRLDAEASAALDEEDWPVERYAPDPGQAGASLGLIGLGLLATWVVDRVGREEEPPAPSSGRRPPQV